MRYKIGDVARILGISADLLRYYEKKGVVTPYKDAHNDYRYYDAWDINLLMDCLWFKNFGYSIEQIADMVRIPSFIVVIASFVTLLQMLMQAYLPDIYATLGLFIPLIVVNCIILGRAEAFAAKNGPVASIFDGIGMGLGFTMALTILGAVREILGTGKLFGLTLMPEEYGMLVFVLAPGAFIALGYLIAIVNKMRKA